MSAATGINHQINFQGKLVNPDGTNVTDGTYSIVFSLYTVSSAGSNIWTETQSVTTVAGIFQVNLGSVTTLPGSVDFNTDNLYLGIKVGSDAEMTPRVQFTAVPQAFNSEKLGGLDKTGFIQNQTATTQTADFKISGNGTIGTSLTTPLLQAAAATALTITGNAASTWSTSAGNITLQAGGGTITLGSTTNLTSTGALTITGGTTLALDSTTTSAVNIGNSANAKTITIGNVTGATQIVLNTGSGGVLVNTLANSQMKVTSNALIPTIDQFTIDNTGSTGVVTAGVNGLSINYKGGAAAVEASGQRIDLQPGGTIGGTWNGVRVVQNVTGPATGVTSNGVKLEGPATTGGAGTYNAINIANIGTVASGGIVRGLNISGTNSQAAGTIRGIQLNNLTSGAASEIGIDLGTGWDSLLTYNNGTKVIINSTGFVQNAAGGTGIDTSGSTGVPSISGGAWSVAANLATSLGGTGVGTFTTNGVLYGNAAGNILVTAASTGAQCLVTASSGVAPTWGACGTGLNLQTDYTASTGSTTPEILLDTTRNGVDIQDANTTIGTAQPLLAVRASATASTLGTLLLGVSNIGKLTVATSASLVNADIGIIQTATFANATASGVVVGYQQNINVAGTTIATNKGFELNLTDNGSLNHLNIGVVVNLAGTSTTYKGVGIDSNVSKGIGVRGTTSGSTNDNSFCLQGNYGSSQAGVCGIAAAGNASAGVAGQSRSNTSGYGVIGSASGTGVAANNYIGLQGFTNQTAAAAYSSYAVWGTAQAGTGATVYGGYFDLTTSNTATSGAALYATTPTYTAAAAGNGINAVNVLQAAGGHGQDASAVTGVTAGNGAAISLVTGAGGLATGASGTNTGGTGGNFVSTLGNGGNATSGIGGAGGNYSFTAGNGGNGTGANANGNGGSITLTAGSAGAGGTGGSAGSVIVKNAANSTTSFQVQNASSVDVITADTTNSQLIVRGINSTAVAGSNLLASQDFTNATYWTTCNGGGGGWTGTTTTATHNTGNTTTCTATATNYTVVSGSSYQVSYTLAGNTTATNTVTVSMGGVTASAIGQTGTNTQIFAATTTTTAALTFTPSTNFNGVISNVSIKPVTLSSSVLTVKNSDASVGLEVRAGGSNRSNTFVGLLSGENTDNTTSNVTGFGAGALQSNVYGYDNTGIGATSLKNNTSGYENTAVGTSTLFRNTTGADNSVVGEALLFSNTTGSWNTGLGSYALSFATTANYNTAIGYQGLYNSTGGQNTAVGANAGNSNNTGINNTYLGYSSGYFDSTSGFATVSTLQNATAIGAYAQVQGSNSLVLGSVDLGTMVGIGTTVPINTLSVSPVDLNSATVNASQSTNTVTAASAIFTSSMVGEQLIFANGTSAGIITGFTSSTVVTVNTSQTVSSQKFRTHHIGLQVTSAGNVGVNVTFAAMSVPGAVPSTSTSSVGGTLAQNSTYRYKITAVDAAGGETTPSVEVSQITLNLTTTNTISLAPWTASTGAVAYRIYRTAANGASNSETLYDTTSSAGFTGTGTGTMTTSGTTTVTGTSTVFMSQLHVGETIIASGQLRRITAIASDTSLTTDTAFSPNLSAAAFTYAQPGYTDFGTGAFTSGSVPTTSNAYVSTNASSGKTLSVAVGGLGSPAGQLYVSGTLPTAPIAKYNTSGAPTNGPWGIYHSGNYIYSVSKASTKLEIVDVTVPQSPKLATNFTITGACETNSVMVAGHYAYVADDCVSKFYIIDVTNVKTPVLVNTITTGAAVGQVLVQGRYAYAFDVNGRMEIYDVGNPTSVPAALSSTLPASATFGMQATVVGRYVYMLTNQSAGNNKLWIYDISNPASPTLANTGGTLLNSTGTQGPVIVGHYAYILNLVTNPTFEAWDITDPTTPFLANSVALDPAVGNNSGSPQWFTMQGRFAYIANEEYNDVNVVDVSNPNAMRLIGAIGTDLAPIAVTVSGRYLYVDAFVDSKIDVYDIGGLYTQSLEVGSLVAGNIESTGVASFDSDLSVSSSASIGQNLQVNHDLGVGGKAVFAAAANSTTAFQVQDASGVAVLNVDTTNHQLTVRGNAASDAATVGGELFNANTFSAATGWTAISGSGPTAVTTHTAGGGVTAVPTTFTPVSGSTYQVVFTVSGNTFTGSYGVSVTMGGDVSPVVYTNATHTLVFSTTSTAALSFTPAITGFNGTISSVSVKLITTPIASVSIQNSTGVTNLEVRANSSSAFLGLSSGQADTSGVQDYALGAYALSSNTTGSNNQAIGYQALQNNTTGGTNLAVGTQALQNNTTGGNNSAIGYQALQNNTTGNANIAMGLSALQNNTIGAINIAIGSSALSNNSAGAQNVAIGNNALQSNGYGNQNTAVGAQSLELNNGGNFNTTLGYDSLDSNITGNNNSAVGSYAGYQDPAITSFVTLGNLTNTTTIGYGSQVQASNSLILGGQGTNQANIGIGTTSPTNLLSVSPYNATFTAGTASVTSGLSAVTGVGTAWTTAMIGDEIIFADGTKYTVSAVGSTTTLTISTTATATETTSAFRVQLPALQVTSTGNVGIGTTAPTFNLDIQGTTGLRVKTTTNNASAFLVQNSTAGSLLNVDTLNSNVTLNGQNSGQLAPFATNTHALPLVRNHMVQAYYNGYIYLMGGTDGTTVFNTVWYAKVNNDGSTGTWTTNANALPQLLSSGMGLAVNGYLYYIGGDVGATVQTATYYAKINSDGSVGAFTATTVLPAARDQGTTVSANGFVYLAGGASSGSGQTTVYYSRVNPDGTLGAWTTSANALPVGLYQNPVVVANGYIYSLGGMNAGSTAVLPTIYYAKLNKDGTNAAFSTATNGLPANRRAGNAVVANGYVYYLGGSLTTAASAQSTVYYSKLGSAGDIASAFTTNTNAIPAIRNYQSAIIANGYIYQIGGSDGAVWQSTVYYASTSRISLSGTVDLVGQGGTNLAEGGTGASLLAGNTSIVGTLNVQDDASFNGSVSTTGQLSVNSNIVGYAATISNASAATNAGVPATSSDGLLINLGTANASRTTGNYFIGFAGAGTVAGKIQGGASAVAYTTTAADYAEYFKADESNLPKAGELVALSSDGTNSVVKATSSMQVAVGVVSTSPGFVGNGPLCKVDDTNCDSDYQKYNALVALSGQVPVKVNMSGGAIVAGDPIGFSATPGVGQKVSNGPIVGYALDATNADGTIHVMIRPGYLSPVDGANLQAKSITAESLQLSGSANVASLNVSGATTLTTLSVTGSTTIGGDLTVTGVTQVADIIVSGHIITAGNVPQIAVLTSAGTNATAVVDGNDTSGSITITTGSPAQPASGSNPAVLGPIAGDLVELTFAKTYTKAPRIMITGDDGSSVTLNVFPGFKDAQHFRISTANLPNPQTNYHFTYYIVE